MSDNTEEAAYAMFADTYPHEAWEQDKEKFCDYVRKKVGNPAITDVQIFMSLQASEGRKDE